MKRRIFSAGILFALVIIIAAAAICVNKKETVSYYSGDNIVLLNEIEALYRTGDEQKAHEKAEELANYFRGNNGEPQEKDENLAIFIMCGISLAFMSGVLLYVYFTILRPFERLSGFAGRLAAGDFETGLEYERGTYFGKFTWAFDSMRREITKARACEREAIDNNKTVIATLSHDIKTPVASIRAYAEALEANMDSTYDKREKYLSVIMRKCDEVSKLTDDLFLHSISDLERIKIDCKSFELNGFLDKAVNELSAGQGDIIFDRPEEKMNITADPDRLMQIIENLVNNSRKYAKTDITILAKREGDSAVLCFTDGGRGIDDEDMPFIFDKFYRGRNCGAEQGSELGLYIVKYLVTKMGGEISLKNLPHGFEATVRLDITS